jgi:hypothetical protein
MGTRRPHRRGVLDHGADEATITIDNTRSNFEPLLSRLAVVVNNVHVVRN